MDLAIVIPAFNEEKGVGAVVQELRALMDEHDIKAEIIVVNDGSTDGTAQAAADAGARVVSHRSNRGYGASLKTGITIANAEVIVITDADGTYPSEAIPGMLAELEKADMVVGARTGTKVKIPLIRKPAKWVLNKLANYVSNAKIPDLNSGLRMFRRDMVMQYFSILPDQFSFTTTITMAMHCDKYAVTYIPINYHRRTGKSKIVAWDAGSFAILILRTAMLFRPLRVFVPLVMVSFFYGLVKMIIDLRHDPMISASSMMGFMSALVILLIGMLGDAIATRMGRLNQNLVAGIQMRELLDMRDTKAVTARPVTTRRR